LPILVAHSPVVALMAPAAMPEARPCCTTMVCFVPQVIQGNADSGGISQAYWTPTMVPVALAPAPIPNSMTTDAGAATGVTQGAYSNLSSNPMWLPRMEDQQQQRPSQQQEEQRVPAQTAMEPGWQGLPWTTMIPAATMMAVPPMQQFQIQQLPFEPTSESELPRKDGSGRGSRPQPSMRRRRRQGCPRNGDSNCAEFDAARPTPGGHQDARRLANQFLERLRRSDIGLIPDEGELRCPTLEAFKRMAFADKASSRAAQLVLQEVSAKECVALASSMRGRVRAGMGSMFANYVLQKVIELTPVSASSFVAEELAGMGAETARHRYGCRILCRLLEFGSVDEPSAVMLFEEVLTDIDEILRHSFGGYVAQHFLEFGSDEQKRRVGQAVRRNLLSNAAHKRGSRIVEAALQQCAEEDRKGIAEELLASRENVLFLAEDQFGCHVVKALLRTSDENRRQIIEMLRPEREQMRSSKYGKYVLAASSAAGLP